MAKPDPAQCYAYRTRKAARFLTSWFNQRLSDTGVRATQTPIFFALDAAGPATVSELARRIGMDQSTLSRNLRPLIDAGWVELRTEKRGLAGQVRLTRSGKAKVRAIYPVWAEAQREFQRTLGPKWEAVTRALDDLAEAGEQLD